MNVSTAYPGSGGGVAPAPQNLREAAQQFEALFVGNLLKSARESGGAEEDNGGAMIKDLADEHLAREIAKGGGLGFAKSVLQQLSPSK